MPIRLKQQKISKAQTPPVRGLFPKQWKRRKLPDLFEEAKSLQSEQLHKNTKEKEKELKQFNGLMRRGQNSSVIVVLTGDATNKTGTSQISAISKAQKYSMNNYWKHLEKVFFKKSTF